MQRVVSDLRRRDVLSRGDLVTLVGHPEALERGVRYLDRDLNRSWTDTRLARLRREGPSSAEGRETLRIARQVEETKAAARGELFLLDLHTTSGASPSFSNAIDRLASRRLALSLLAPVVLGIEELLDGTLVDWLDHQGFTGTVFEAGQHDDPRSIDRAEAAIWLALAALRMLPDADPQVVRSRQLLEVEVRDMPNMVELTYRHALDDRSEFRMLPGFRSFQKVTEGQLLAYELENRVTAPHEGRLLMPLYQPQGDEGFFLTSDYGPNLRVASQLLRRSGLLELVHGLPGVRRDPQSPKWLLLDRALRSGAERNLLRLLGYRRERTWRGKTWLGR